MLIALLDFRDRASQMKAADCRRSQRFFAMENDWPSHSLSVAKILGRVPNIWTGRRSRPD
jgi:hypothetical protein